METGPAAGAPTEPAPPGPRPATGLPEALRRAGRRAKQSFLRFWRTEDRFLGILRDVSVAGVIVLAVMGLIWGYTGQPFPSQAPIVVVESGSMMHAERDTGYGRLGTIDPGDLILVKDVDDERDVEGREESGSESRYGARGDVIIYRPWGKPELTPIIHRAMFWIEAVPVGAPECGSDAMRYSYWVSGQARTCKESVEAPEIGLLNYRPAHSGFVTKGDNPVTNLRADQALGGVFPEPVSLEWVIGKARGEIPWFGLIKLALYGNPSAHGSVGWCPVMKAIAPCDLWNMLAVSLGVLISAPIILDAAVHVARKRKAARGRPGASRPDAAETRPGDRTPPTLEPDRPEEPPGDAGEAPPRAP